MKRVVNDAVRRNTLINIVVSQMITAWQMFIVTFV